MKKFIMILSAFAVLFLFASCGTDSAYDDPDTDTEQNMQSEVDSPNAPQQTQNDENDADMSDESDTAREQAPESDPDVPEEPQPEATPEEEDINTMKIEILVGNKTFSATLYDNAAAKALYEKLPMTLDMTELNGNEKYYYLDDSLPTDSSRPDGIETGDLMLYGSDCLVVFYKSFSTSYSYTPLGKIDDPTGLASALGSGSVTVTFQK